MQGYIHAFSLNGTYYLVCFSNDYLTSIFLLGKTSKIYRISQVREWVHLYNWNSSKLLLCLLLEMANGNDNLLPLQPLAVHRYSDHSPDFCRDMWLRKTLASGRKKIWRPPAANLGFCDFKDVIAFGNNQLLQPLAAKV